MRREAATRAAHTPPLPQNPIEPAYPPIEEALADIDFPITKIELMGAVHGRTVVFRGANADLEILIRDILDDAFESEDELRDALVVTYGRGPEEVEEAGWKRRRATGMDVVEDAVGDLDP